MIIAVANLISPGLGLGATSFQWSTVVPEVEWSLTLTGQLERKHSIESCLLYTSPSPRDATLSRMPSSA